MVSPGASQQAGSGFKPIGLLGFCLGGVCMLSVVFHTMTCGLPATLNCTLAVSVNGYLSLFVSLVIYW